MITAANITNGGAFTISANGTDQTVVSTGDGAGGGGAGGTIMLNISGGFTNAVTISAKGGKGGDHNNNTCHGTGGGGGGGVVWFSAGSLPANASTNVVGGANGTQVAITIDCGDINWGATAGSSGLVKFGLAAGATSFINSNTCGGGPLPITLVSFAGVVNKDKVQLEWATSSEINNDYFVIEKSADGNYFSEVAKVSGAGNSTAMLNYHATDYNPDRGTSYYRLKQVDFDGKTTYSKWVDVNVQVKYDISVFPNPIKGNAIRINLPEKPTSSCRVYINDLTGKKVYDKIVQRELFDNTIDINDAHIEGAGLYYLIVEEDGSSYSKKMHVELE
jgi:hypothetical protein